jgi:hypothetical protein
MKKPAQHLIAEAPRRQSRVELTLIDSLLFINLHDFLYVTDVLSGLPLGLVELPFRLGVGISKKVKQVLLHLCSSTRP